MQPQPNPGTNNVSLVTEIAMFIIAGFLIIGGIVLLYLGTINFTDATFLFVTALGLIGYNLAYKAPSPAQQTQLLTTQQNVGQALTQVVSVLPVFASLLHSHGPQSAMPAAVQPSPQPEQVTQPIRQPAPPQAMPVSLQPQFRPSPLPDISMPLNVVTPPPQQ